MLSMAAAEPAVNALTGVERSALRTVRPPGGLEWGLFQVSGPVTDADEVPGETERAHSGKPGIR
jgi:hypothetical protein